jgi:hypothetical protein
VQANGVVVLDIPGHDSQGAASGAGCIRSWRIGAIAPACRCSADSTD